uniref:GRF-type domain-containing protein n=1 Tax=Lactuca sativa TaxID=4236 RepID=A0A9R1VZV2_LACSA|nr:hypothetical protein LSAT_V11C400183480 [Lactuca sativa]
MVVIRCDCGDVCGVSISRTPDNPGRKFWGRPNYQGCSNFPKRNVEGGNCGFFKWADEELGQNMEMCHTQEIKPLLELIIQLLVVISLILAIVGDEELLHLCNVFFF